MARNKHIDREPQRIAAARQLAVEALYRCLTGSIASSEPRRMGDTQGHEAGED